MSDREGTKLAETADPVTSLSQAYKRADKPDANPEDVEALVRLVRQHPHLMRKTADLAAASVNVAIQGANATPAVREVLRCSVDQVKASLGYERAVPVERLLVEQVALCYLRMNLAEQSYEGVMSQEHSLKLGAYWEKKLSSAQRRYLQAVETFARVRKLLSRPAIQFNIATHDRSAAGSRHGRIDTSRLTSTTA